MTPDNFFDQDSTSIALFNSLLRVKRNALSMLITRAGQAGRSESPGQRCSGLLGGKDRIYGGRTACQHILQVVYCSGRKRRCQRRKSVFYHLRTWAASFCHLRIFCKSDSSVPQASMHNISFSSWIFNAFGVFLKFSCFVFSNLSTFTIVWKCIRENLSAKLNCHL